MNAVAQSSEQAEPHFHGNLLTDIQQQISNHILQLISDNQPQPNSSQLKTQDLAEDNLRYLNTSTGIEREVKQITKVLSKIYTEVHEQGATAKKIQLLTKQELTIFHLIAKGLQSKEIAAQLFISTHTVNAHRKNIYKKLEINNIASIVKLSMIIDMV